MSARWVLDNLEAFWLQVALLLAAGVIPAWVCRRQARARLIGGQILLVVCLLLPLVEPWTRKVVPVRAVAGGENPAPLLLDSAGSSHGGSISWPAAVLLLIAGGGILRLGFLALRIARLRRYRRQSRPLEPAPAWGVEASLRVSEHVPSAVTFGWRDPVVLLPVDFPRLALPVQDAILCHEVLHVRRRDWLATVGEECVRALFWFHPAIWWLLGEIGLAREQEVDRESIAITGQRDEYMDALLVMASRSYADLTPAPRFLRRRQLARRMAAIAATGAGSWTQTAGAAAAMLALTVAAGWAGATAFPLSSAPQPAPYVMTIEPEDRPVRGGGVQFGAIAIVGLADDSRQSLLAQLPVRAGDPYTADSIEWVRETAARYDRRLVLQTRLLRLPEGAGKTALLEISAPDARFNTRPQRIRVSDYLMTPNLLKRVSPVIPREAAARHVSGSVLLDAVIGTGGTVVELRALRGPSVLMRPTMDAVRQWIYRPTVLSGRPVEIETTVEIVYPRQEGESR